MELTKEFQDLGLVQKPEDMYLANGEIGILCAIKATNRQTLIDYINAFIGSDFFVKNPNADYLHVELSGEQLGCDGGSATYKSEADIPYQSVPCPCGNPKHWLIKYEELKWKIK